MKRTVQVNLSDHLTCASYGANINGVSESSVHALQVNSKQQ